MTPTEHINEAFRLLRLEAKTSQTEHAQYMQVINEERNIKTELVARLGFTLTPAFESLSTKGTIRVMSRAPTWNGSNREREHGSEHLEFVCEDGRYTWREYRDFDSGLTKVPVTAAEVVEHKWPVETLFSRTHQLMMEANEGIRMERIMEVRVVSSVLKGLCGAWHRGGLVGV